MLPRGRNVRFLKFTIMSLGGNADKIWSGVRIRLKYKKTVYSLIQNHVERHFIRQKSHPWCEHYYNHLNPESLLRDIRQHKIPDILIVDERFALQGNEESHNPILELLKEVRARSVVIPSIVMILNDDQILAKNSANKSDRSIEYFKLGVNDFIHRPVSSEELGDQLHTIFERIYRMTEWVDLINLSRSFWLSGEFSDFVASLETLRVRFGPNPFTEVLLVEVYRSLGQIEESLKTARDASEMLPESIILREELALSFLASGERDLGFQEYLHVCRVNMTRERAGFLYDLVTMTNSGIMDHHETLSVIQIFAHHPKIVGTKLRTRILQGLAEQAQSQSDAEFVLDLMDLNLDLRASLGNTLLHLKRFWPALDEMINPLSVEGIVKEERAVLERLLFNVLGGDGVYPEELLLWCQLKFEKGQLSLLETELLNLQTQYEKVPQWYYCMSKVQLLLNNFAAASHTNISGLRRFPEDSLLRMFKKEWQQRYDEFKALEAS
jgi:tetratricopeptide (TPR) repeat protein